MIKEEAKQKIAELVAKYGSLSPSEVKGYHEAKTKQGFIEPMFRALGWNFEDTNEVAPEETASGGRVDYAFKLNGVSRFYMEAKPLRADLTKEEYVKQAITYAYTKGVTWAVLTDFEGIQVYNAQTGSRFINLTYDKYLTDFEDLWLLAKESFQINALNEKAEKYGALPTRLGIEQRLFNQLRQWREELSTQLHAYNKKLSVKQIDEIIQRLFNRLIFIRTCEDRGIEDKILLGAVHEWVRTKRKGELIETLRSIFRYFDGFYDSDLFQHHLTDETFIEGATIENIINGLYEVRGGMAYYDFSLIDADVLGAVYEQYLGHIANIVKQRAKEAQAKMDLGLPYDETIELTEKKQRRKEHGIYYTPKFITDYIVKETVGRFLKEHSPAEVRNIKILDPACGSGSFLIRAFDELLKYYGDQKTSKSVNQIDAADRLSILTSNIYGVDLDIQAVEIARLNLLLRSLAKRETLPTLRGNIRQGNSLISGSEEELKGYFGKNWREKRPFNWKEEFRDIMDNGGFDVVIGNPPYVNEARGNKELFRELKILPELQEYYEKNMDLFNFFIERGLDLLKEGGILGYIIPAYWQDRTGATLLRKKIIKETNIECLVNLREFKVFEEAPGQHNNILILQKATNSDKKNTLSYVELADNEQEKKGFILKEPEQLRYELTYNKLIIGDIILNLTQKIDEEKSLHFNKEEVVRGVDTSPSTYESEGVFILSEREYQALSKTLEIEQRREFFKPFYEARQIDRYYYEPKNNLWIIYTDARRKKLLENNKKKYKAIVNHLDKFGDIITSANKPYGLHRAKKESNFLEKEKILFVRKTPYPKFVSVPIPYFVDESIYLIIWNRPLYNHKYLLSILNSRLAGWWFSIQKKHGTQLQIDKEQILSFPIRSLNFNVPSDKGLHDKLVILAEKMLELNKKLAPMRDLPIGEHDEIKRGIERTDKEIDNLVYDLYGLTEEERKIVEGGF